MPIIYVIKENKTFSKIDEYNHNSIEESYWTISAYATEFENTFQFDLNESNAVELSRYGPFVTYKKAEQALYSFAENTEEVVQYGSCQFGPTLVFQRHPLSFTQLSKNAHHFNISQ